MNIYKLFTVLLLVGLWQGALAQKGEDEQEMRDRMEAFRAQFLTEQLDLTPEEAQRFWPVYNQYRKELDAIQEKRMKRHGKHRGHAKEALNELSEEQIYQQLEEEMKMQQNLLDLRRKYYERFDEVLPIKKVALLYMAEGEFQRRLIRRLGERGKPPGH